MDDQWMERLLAEAHDIGKAHVRSVMEDVRAEMGEEGAAITIGEPADGDSFANLKFPSQEVADKFMSRFRERMASG